MRAFDFSFTLTGKGWGSKLEDPAQDHPDPPNKTMIVKVGRALMKYYSLTSDL
jgi:hypothetical protein